MNYSLRVCLKLFMSGPGCYFSVKRVSRELEVGNRGGWGYRDTCMCTLEISNLNLNYEMIIHKLR